MNKLKLVLFVLVLKVLLFQPVSAHADVEADSTMDQSEYEPVDISALNSLSGWDLADLIRRSDQPKLEWLMAQGLQLDAFNSLSRWDLAHLIRRSDQPKLEWLMAQGLQLDALNSLPGWDLADLIKQIDQPKLEFLMTQGLQLDALNSLSGRDLTFLISQIDQPKLEYLMSQGFMTTVNSLSGRDLADFIGNINQPKLEWLMAQGLQLDLTHWLYLELASSNRSYGFVFLLRSFNREIYNTYVSSYDFSTIQGRVKFVVEQVIDLEKYVLIGFSNEFGQWSEGLSRALEKAGEAYGNILIVPVHSELSQDEVFLSKFTAFVNPGMSDTYPMGKTEFNYDDIDKDKMMESEKAYQNIVTFTKKHHIPYLGICAGSQHLILNNGGYLQPARGSSHVKFIKGTMPHFLTLTPEEQIAALNECIVEDADIDDASVAHSFAGISSKVDAADKRMKLGAHYNDNNELVAAAVAYGATKFGFQFHPEHNYESNPQNGEVNRNKNIIQNFIAICYEFHRNIVLGRQYGLTADEVKMNLERTYEYFMEVIEECQSEEVSEGAISQKKQGKPVFLSKSLKEKAINISEEEIVDLFLYALPGVTPEDILFTRTGTDLSISVNGAGEVLNIPGYFESYYVPNPGILQFSEGSHAALPQSEDMPNEAESVFPLSRVEALEFI